ncbi:MAG: 4-(cytidine 5'-diphospho)-2-C-methyl-D-erythritol kinase [Clostridia bacterium]
MIIEKAHAKINLGLDILGKRKDGFHDLDTIMQTVDLHDLVLLKKTPSGITVRSDSGDIPLDGKNLGYQAAYEFFAYTGIRNGVEMEMIKNIPVEAGLAGGSSDAAAVIRGLDSLFETGLSMEEKEKLGLLIGSDVPFCMAGKTQRATGRGEVLKKLPGWEGLPLVIVRPLENVQTGWAFSLYDPAQIKERPDMDALEEIVRHRRKECLASRLVNVFEEVVFPHKGMIKKAKYDMMKTRPLACSMTGSGACVFAIYASKEEAAIAWSGMKKEGYESFLTQTR